MQSSQNKKKPGRMRHRTRQRMSRRMVIILSASSVAAIAIVMTFFFNFSNTESTHAQVGAAPNVLMVPDQQFTDEKSLAAPFIDNRLNAGPTTVMVRAAKPLGAPKTNSMQ